MREGGAGVREGCGGGCGRSSLQIVTVHVREATGSSRPAPCYNNNTVSRLCTNFVSPYGTYIPAQVLRMFGGLYLVYLCVSRVVCLCIATCSTEKKSSCKL